MLYYFNQNYNIPTQKRYLKEITTKKSIELLGFSNEKSRLSFIKLLLFGESLLEGKVDHFPTDFEAISFLKENQNLSINYINEKFQKYYLRLKRIFIFKKIKSLITDKKETDLLQKFKNELDDIFFSMKITEKSTINDITDEQVENIVNQNGIKQIRVLGTNHVLMREQLIGLRNELDILREKKLLNKNYRILLLCGNHINKGYKEDYFSECKHMKNLSYEILEDESNSDRIKIVKTTKKAKNIGRPNTVNTVLKADELFKPKENEIIIYSSFSSAFSYRTNYDIERDSNNIINTNRIFINQSQLELVQGLLRQKEDNIFKLEKLIINRKKLRFYEIKLKISIFRNIKRLRKDNDVIDIFLKLRYSIILDNLTRAIYSVNIKEGNLKK